jgi:hypothetical protein
VQLGVAKVAFFEKSRREKITGIDCEKVDPTKSRSEKIVTCIGLCSELNSFTKTTRNQI